MLRRLREARGWSWSDLARALRDAAHRLAEPAQARQQVSSVQRTVARWESLTDRTSPGERYQFLLAHLYARTPNGTVALGPGSDFAALLDALRHFGTPFVRLQLLLTPIVGTCRRLLRANQTSPREHLLLLATNAYALSARLAFETRDDVTAMSLYAEAAEAAGGLADRSSLAAVRTSHTMVVLHATGDLAAAGRIAKAATIEAHRGASYAIRARAHAVHAEISARAGHA